MELVKLLFQADTKDLDTAEGKLKNLAKVTKDTVPGIDLVGKSFAGLANPIAGAVTLITAIATGFAVLIKNTVAANDALGDMADELGTTVEQLDIMKQVAAQSGLEFEKVHDSMIKFQKAQADAVDGTGKQSAAFKALGYDAQGTGATYEDVAKRLAVMESGWQKNHLAMTLLGKSATKLNEFLGDLARKGEMNSRVTAQNAIEADRLGRAWNSFTLALTKMTMGPANSTISFLTQMLTRVAAISKYIDETPWYKVTSWGMNSAGNDAVAKQKFLDGIQVGGLDQQDTMDRRLNNGVNLANAYAWAEKEKDKKAKVKKDDDFDGWSAYKDKSWGGTEAAWADEQIKKLIEDTKKLQETSDRAGEASSERWATEVKNIENLANPMLKYEEQMQRIRAAYVDGSISVETYSAAMNSVYKSMQDVTDKSRPLVDDMNKMMEQLTQAIEGYTQRMSDAFIDFALNGKMSFKDLIGSMLSDMAKMLMNQAFKQFIGAMGRGSAEGGIMGAIGNAVISIFGAAEGGPIAGTTLVGEKGPELFVPNGAGTIIPNHMLGSGSAPNINIINNVTVQGGKTNEETGAAVTAEMTKVMKTVARNEIAQAMRPGGISNPMSVRG